MSQYGEYCHVTKKCDEMSRLQCFIIIIMFDSVFTTLAVFLVQWFHMRVQCALYIYI